MCGGIYEEDFKDTPRKDNKDKEKQTDESLHGQIPKAHPWYDDQAA